MRVLAYDPYVKETDMNVEIVDLDTLVKRSDIISLHIPHTDSTHYIIDADAIAKMKDGVMIINCARGAWLMKKRFSTA